MDYLKNQETRLLPDECYYPDRRLVVSGLVIHFISARNINHADRFSTRLIEKILKDYGFSAHYGIERSGRQLIWVPENRVAKHAGRSKMFNLTGLNAHCIGIEVYGTNDEDFTPMQYLSLAQLVVSLIIKYGLKTNWIKGHEQVSNHEVRPDPKVDPGIHFNWMYFGHLVYKMLEEKGYAVSQ